MLLLSLILLTGCESECQSDTRMNGSYSASSFVSSPTEEITGENIADYPWPRMFFNGFSLWTLEHVGGQQTVKLTIDEQPFTADFAREPENCTDFLLSFAGTYLTDEGSTHSFVWSGEMYYQGPHIGGTWSYQDTWNNNAEGLSGTIDIPEGNVALTKK
jgi:hypothetical protein